MAIVCQCTTISIARIYVRIFLSCARIIVIRIVNNRVHIEYAFALTILPEGTLVCKLLCRNNNCLLECLFDIAIQTSSVNVFNVDFECRSISLVCSIVSQCTNSLRIHSPNQVERSVVFSIVQETEYKILGILDGFTTVFANFICSFFPVIQSICRLCQCAEVNLLTIFSEFKDFDVLVDAMELSLTHTLSTIELNHVVNLLIHFLREQLLEHVMTSYSVVRECDGSNSLILFTSPTDLDVANCNHVTIILIPQLSANDRLTTDRSLRIFIVSQLYVINFRLQSITIRQDTTEFLLVCLAVTLQILGFCQSKTELQTIVGVVVQFLVATMFVFCISIAYCYQCSQIKRFVICLFNINQYIIT